MDRWVCFRRAFFGENIPVFVELVSQRFQGLPFGHKLKIIVMLVLVHIGLQLGNVFSQRINFFSQIWYIFFVPFEVKKIIEMIHHEAELIKTKLWFLYFGDLVFGKEVLDVDVLDSLPAWIILIPYQGFQVLHVWRWNKNHYQTHQLFHNCIFDSVFVESSDLGFGFLFKILGVLFWSSYVAKRLLVGIGSSWVWWYVFIFVFREDLWFFPLFFAIRSEKTLTQPPK